MILGGLSAVMTGKWVAYNGNPPGEAGHDQMGKGMRDVGAFMARCGLIAVPVGFLLLLVTVVV